MCICCVVLRSLCDGLITRPVESYRVSVCVWSRNPEREAKDSSWTISACEWMNKSRLMWLCLFVTSGVTYFSSVVYLWWWKPSSKITWLQDLFIVFWDTDDKYCCPRAVETWTVVGNYAFVGVCAILVIAKAKLAKAAPLHTMKVLGGRGGIDSTHSRPWYWMWVSGQRHDPAAL
jgi:hypothetical protein